MDYNKKAWKAYTLRGTGDHPSEGGKVVQGVTGPIHVMSGIESDIMKVHGKEGERILSQRKGYGAPENSPVDSMSGYHKYGDDYTQAERHERLGGSSGWWEGMQSRFGWGDYGDTEMMNAQLEGMFRGSYGNLMSGTEDMFAFMDTQLQQQLYQGGQQQEMLDIDKRGLDVQGQKLDIAEAGLDRNVMQTRDNMAQYAGGTGGSRTGLITGSDQATIETLERQGTAAMEDIGRSRQNINLQREEVALAGETLDARGNILESQMEGMETQMDISKFNYATSTGQQLANMMTQFMSATGEDIPDDFMDMYSEYMETYG